MSDMGAGRTVTASGPGSIAIGGDVREGSIVATVNILVQGIRTFLPDYAGRIQSFLAEYLGTSTAAVPFGGRSADLDALDAWLDDPRAPSYLLLAAPAGRDKECILYTSLKHYCCDCPVHYCFEFWQDFLSMSCSGTGRIFLTDPAALPRVVSELGDESAVDEAGMAIL